VTSLGLVQMTRKRVGQGLLEAFSEICKECAGRGVILTHDPVVSKRPAKARSSAGMQAVAAASAKTKAHGDAVAEAVPAGTAAPEAAGTEPEAAEAAAPGTEPAGEAAAAPKRRSRGGRGRGAASRPAGPPAPVEPSDAQSEPTSA
jgi:ribonuclease E